MSDLLLRFESHTGSEDAEVAVYPDRVEWFNTGSSVRHKRKGVYTIPLGAISSVWSKKDGLRHTVIGVDTSGGTVSFRVQHEDARPIRELLDELQHGTHPAQRPDSHLPATAPSVVPGWYHSPFGRHELRYWDGAGWTEHVADAGAVGLDPIT